MLRCHNSENFPTDIKSPVVALGNFDGVHVGHRELINRARTDAAKRGGRCVVYTFDPHPVRTLSPKYCPPLLQTLEQKLDMLESLGIDICVIEPFTLKFSHLDAGSFLKTVLLERLSAIAIVVGYDFTFGLHREGTIETLEDFGRKHDISIHTVEAQFINETLISSTNIRKMISEGDIKTAATLLGRPYAIGGKIVRGRGLGGRLNAPTANIETQNEIIPKNGVYITKTRISEKSEKNSEIFPSITSIGDNPTFPGTGFAVETHILDFDKDIAGWNVEIEFLKRIRVQIAFDTPAQLAEQIRKDIEEARRHHKSEAGSMKQEAG